MDIFSDFYLQLSDQSLVIFVIFFLFLLCFLRVALYTWRILKATASLSFCFAAPVQTEWVEVRRLVECSRESRFDLCKKKKANEQWKTESGMSFFGEFSE